MLLSRAIAGYEENQKALKRLAIETTLRSYVNMLQEFARWIERDGIAQATPPRAAETSDLSRVMFMRFYDGICARVPKKALQVRAANRSFAKYLIRIQEIDRDFTADVELPRTDPSERVAPSEADIDKMLAAVEEMEFCGNAKAQDRKRHVVRTVMHLLIFAGLRRKEIFDLRVQDIDIDNRQIYVRFGKGNHPGYVKAPGEFWPLIRTYLKQRPAYPGDILLAYSETMPIGEHGVSRIFENVLKAAELDGHGITPHCLRHAFCLRGIENGADIKTIQIQMRHVHPQTTMKYLVTNHPVTDEKADAFGRSPVQDATTTRRQEQTRPAPKIKQKPNRPPAQGNRSSAPGRVRIDLRRPPEKEKKILRMVTRRTA